MTNIRKIDYELYLNLIKNDYAFRTPIDYPILIHPMILLQIKIINVFPLLSK